jgi:FtsP/CotA-like multicopper oxidase with cupredoxin domain
VRRLTAAWLIGAASLLAAPSASEAATREYWVAAVPVTLNIAPNGRDAIHGTALTPAETVFGTVVYRRYTKGWKRPIENVTAPGSGNTDLIPGPLIRARVGDKIRVHFKNLDTAFNRSHSMHFHGVHYRPSSDGAFLPGFSGPDAEVMPGETYTYRLRAGRDSVGAWPYHDHSPSMEASIHGGMWGMLSIRGRSEPLPDREFVVVFAPMGPPTGQTHQVAQPAITEFQTIDGRAFVGNTPVFHASVGQTVQWDVMGMGSEHHTFHVHGHRWRERDGTPRDTQTVGPAESFRIRWREQAPGTWLYHCHVEAHMAAGMIGIYRVSPRG